MRPAARAAERYGPDAPRVNQRSSFSRAAAKEPARTIQRIRGAPRIARRERRTPSGRHARRTRCVRTDSCNVFINPRSLIIVTGGAAPHGDCSVRHDIAGSPQLWNQHADRQQGFSAGSSLWTWNRRLPRAVSEFFGQECRERMEIRDRGVEEQSRCRCHGGSLEGREAVYLNSW
jgi:hypothetical protein